MSVSTCTSSLSPIMLWSNPKETAAIFTPTLVLLLAVSCYSIISVVSISSLLVLLSVVLCKLYTHVMVKLLAKLPAEPSSDPLHKVYSMDLTISTDCVESITGKLIDCINTSIGQLRSLFLFDNYVESLKFGVALYCITYIGSLCNLLTIITLAWTALFTLPRLYIDNQVAMDSLMEKMMVQVEQLKSKMTSMVTRGGATASATPAKDVEKKSPQKEE